MRPGDASIVRRWMPLKAASYASSRRFHCQVLDAPKSCFVSVQQTLPLSDAGCP
ncbi:hypothetical protein HanXRQr2_Chr09g0402341 [Helianthus annuus]|uniref:Uncharacterized protein n=1 Tax=Helianthus annuus TaxID=4232 RepID=A0A9K3N9Y5_HELAN|nr:hypothetical protein HanXRQr2_Chr09g0402341 [Helianthus annuus]